MTVDNYLDPYFKPIKLMGFPFRSVRVVRFLNKNILGFNGEKIGVYVGDHLKDPKPIIAHELYEYGARVPAFGRAFGPDRKKMEAISGAITYLCAEDKEAMKDLIAHSLTSTANSNTYPLWVGYTKAEAKRAMEKHERTAKFWLFRNSVLLNYLADMYNKKVGNNNG